VRWRLSVWCIYLNICRIQLFPFFFVFSSSFTRVLHNTGFVAAEIVAVIRLFFGFLTSLTFHCFCSVWNTILLFATVCAAEIPKNVRSDKTYYWNVISRILSRNLRNHVIRRRKFAVLYGSSGQLNNNDIRDCIHSEDIFL